MEKERCIFYYILLSLYFNKEVISEFVKDKKFVTFWGQNKANAALDTVELHLTSLCSKDSPYSTIVVGYVNRYVDTTNKDLLPGMDFSIHCAKQKSSFLFCPHIGRDIRFCQERAKKILIGIGGPGSTAKFESAQGAEEFAKLIWNLFLGGEEANDLRPFGNVIMNGINFFMQNNNPLHSNVFIQTLDHLRSRDLSRQYLITISPSCLFPDPFFGPEGNKILDISKKIIDEVYVRFTENQCCMKKSPGFRESLIRWTNFIIRANHPKLYIGVPAAIQATQFPGCYRKPLELTNVYKSLKAITKFEGFLIIDNSFDLQNLNEGFLFSKPLQTLIGDTQLQIQNIETKYQKPLRYPENNYESPTNVTALTDNVAQINNNKDTTQDQFQMEPKNPNSVQESVTVSEPALVPKPVIVPGNVTLPQPVTEPKPVTALNQVSELKTDLLPGEAAEPETTSNLNTSLGSEQVFLSETKLPIEPSLETVAQTTLKTPVNIIANPLQTISNTKPFRLIFESITPTSSVSTSTFQYPTEPIIPSTENPIENLNEIDYINLDDDMYENDEEEEEDNSQVFSTQNCIKKYPDSKVNEEPVEDNYDKKKLNDEEKQSTKFDQNLLKEPTKCLLCMLNCKPIKKHNATQGLFFSNLSSYKHFLAKSNYSLNKGKSLKKVEESDIVNNQFNVSISHKNLNQKNKKKLPFSKTKKTRNMKTFGTRVFSFAPAQHSNTKQKVKKLDHNTKSRRKHDFQTTVTISKKRKNKNTSLPHLISKNSPVVDPKKSIKIKYSKKKHILSIWNNFNNTTFDSPIKKGVLLGNLISEPNINVIINISGIKDKFAQNVNSYGISIKTTCPNRNCNEHPNPNYFYEIKDLGKFEPLKLSKKKILYPNNELEEKHFKNRLFKYAKNSSVRDKVEHFVPYKISLKSSNDSQKLSSNIQMHKKALVVDKTDIEKKFKKINTVDMKLRLTHVKNVYTDENNFKNLINKIQKDIVNANNVILKSKKPKLKEEH
ncbi:uncharacterized protein LOC100207836 isoform X2 [Hydra vulgaris]|uniref:Uncharacterized protein LOC100207836 isoform X2 n=1 Tax=Hydra vulgaris TaxID=6087 RepID=A0ABM4BFB9_HYDVU